MIHTKEKAYTIYNASCLDVMDSMEENSIDCIVTDPPYEIGFMNKKWDNTGIAFSIDTWEKALRVLKPGGYLLAFNHSRTFHRMMVAIEDAGFELRDTIMWLYGSGFPKSHNISKAIDKQLGVESEVIGIDTRYNEPSGIVSIGRERELVNRNITKPTSPQAKQWDGWGSALKPAYEPIVVARKPFKGSLTENVMVNGVGGLNIDECRIETDEKWEKQDYADKTNSTSYLINKDYKKESNNLGRFPSNIILDGSEEVVSGFPNTKQGGSITKKYKINNEIYGDYGECNTFDSYADEGSASRYFYTAKASVKDREDGLKKFENQFTASAEFRPNHMEKAINGEDGNPYGRWNPRKNIHPTVKPTDLMQYLVRLVAPKGSTILDIFMGSGSTGKAVMMENTERDANYHFIGIDLEKEYCDIAKARIEWGINFRKVKDKRVIFDEKGNKKKAVQETLF